MTENRTIEKVDFSENGLDEIYYNCTFKSCNFSKISIQGTDFEECLFDTCDFSLCKFKNRLRDVKFRECKMVGADFVELYNFSNGLIFENAYLNYANFVATKIRKTLFRNCIINEVYFDRADLTLSIFDNCDLARTSFNDSNLERVDFSKSFNFSINPSACKLKKTIFSESELKGLLTHLNIVIKPIGDL